MIVALQVAAILVVGIATVARFHIFAAVDEQAHIAYVEEIADQGALPWLGRTLMPAQLQAVDHSPAQGFGRLSWEAFQPPLYYLLATPAFAAGGGVRGKVIALRAFDLLLLMVGVGLLALLARAAMGSRWLSAYSLALSILLWPGVIVRAITVSNEALEIPLVLGYLVVLWQAARRRQPWMLLGGGALLGACVLTQLTLVCLAPLLAVPMISVLRRRRDRPAIVASILAILTPLALIAPWLISNELRYGALTASALAEHEQRALYPRTGAGVSALVSVLWRLPRAVLPQEWWPEYGKVLLGSVLRALAAALVLLASVPVIRRPRLLLSRAGALLAAPLVLCLATLAAIVLVADWPPVLVPRFLNPMLAPLALFAAWAWRRADVAERWIVGAAGVISLVSAFAWVYMSGAYYFTNVGRALGIHAA